MNIQQGLLLLMVAGCSSLHSVADTSDTGEADAHPPDACVQTVQNSGQSPVELSTAFTAWRDDHGDVIIIGLEREEHCSHATVSKIAFTGAWGHDPDLLKIGTPDEVFETKVSERDGEVLIFTDMATLGTPEYIMLWADNGEIDVTHFDLNYVLNQHQYDDGSGREFLANYVFPY